MPRIFLKSCDTLVPLLAFVVMLSGCTTAPAEQQIGQTSSATKVSSVRQQPELHQNAEIVWGGSVIGIDNRAEETWIEIVERPLHRRGMPDLKEDSTGRFIAVVPGFLDPLNYSNGRSITIAGTVNGSETRKIAQADYDYPVVAVVDHRLWSDAEARVTGHRYSSRLHYPYYGYYPYQSFYGRHRYGSIFGRHRSGGFISGRARFRF